MFRRLGWLIGQSSHKCLPHANPPTAPSSRIKPVVMFDIVQEVAVYIHRFHNLDLFQQGWYQIKISMRWEADQYIAVATPARVIQYEGADIHGVWKIDDVDNSFFTQPFRIKYARQDVRLAIMISFNMSLSRNEVDMSPKSNNNTILQAPSTSAVILKFELMQAPTTENGVELLASFDASSVAIHEFRIPPKALLGLHSYCPVHFDIFHAVLVDVSVHVSLLKAGLYTKVLSDGPDGDSHEFKQSPDRTSVDSKQISLIKALIVARNTLVEELQNLSKAIDQPVDLAIYTSTVDEMKIFDLQQNLVGAYGDASGQVKPRNGLKEENGNVDFKTDGLAKTFSKDAITNIFFSLGAQLSYLWGTFLRFHRLHKTEILEVLRDAWAKDRKAEWSIWMVYSKVEMPHHFVNSDDGSSSNGAHRRVSTSWKLNDDPAQYAATRAELHRRSIAQMRINNRSIQDMQIFGDPLRVPIVIVERVLNAPKRTFSENSYFRNLDWVSPSSLLTRPGNETGENLSGPFSQQKGRDLKIVVFVHGFQGHHLDLRLVRNQWLLIDPKLEFLMSEANEDKTSGDFREMGHRLGQEVISFIKKKMDKASRSGTLRDVKLSFVGHSIGNVIIRTALADGIMEPYLRYLHTYVSISGPHLGYLYSSNSLFNSGMWLLKKLKGTQCIHQLTFTDEPDLRNTFFYKLCAQKTLDNFRNIILLSSPQDGYVPYHSARIEECQAAALDYSKKGRIFMEMLNNCLDQIRAPTLEQRLFMRCDVNFDASAYGRNFNSFIGRAAHIEFLESDSFVKFIMWSFPGLFR